VYEYQPRHSFAAEEKPEGCVVVFHSADVAGLAFACSRFDTSDFGDIRSFGEIQHFIIGFRRSTFSRSRMAYPVADSPIFSRVASITMKHLFSALSRAPNTALEPTAAAPSFYGLRQIHACSFSRRGSALDR
jgi:hypothetical protein